MDVVSYLLSKQYINDSLAGAGAIKGKSAYEIACENGFKGTPTEWLTSLKGDTPQIGPSGTWIIGEVDTGVLASPDMAGYATEDFVKQQISDTISEDLASYVTRQELSEAILGIKIPNVDDFVTQEDIDNAISNIIFPEVDLTEYALKTDLPSIEGLASESYVQEQIGNIIIPDQPDLSPYALKSELPSLEGLATEEFVNQKLNEIEYPSVDLTGYATEEFVQQKIAEAQLGGNEVDLSAYYTKSEVDKKFNEIPDFSEYVTEEYVQSTISDLIGEAPDNLNTLDKIATVLNNNSTTVDTLTSEIENKADKSEIPSIDGLASEEYVNNMIAEKKIDINVYELTSESTIIDELISLLPEDAEIHCGDVMLVSNSLGVKSAYQFDDEWIACDGNVDASKVIMPFDITLAGSYTQVGNLSKTSTGIATFATKGKSVANALQEILSKREQPKIKSNPSVSLTASHGAKEVGTELTPEWNAVLNAGSYTYGPTGIAASSWEISDTEGNIATSASGNFNKIIVEDSTKYCISAKAFYEDGLIAQDNLGDPSNPVVQISKGNKIANGGYITGYRAWFMYVGEDLSEINSVFIRNSSNMGATPETQNKVNIEAGTKRIMVAIPFDSDLKLKSVIDIDGMGLDVFENFTLKTINVEGLNGYEAKPYNVWVAENENGIAATHYNLIIG